MPSRLDEAIEQIALLHSLAILRKGRRVPHRVVRRKPHEPAVAINAIFIQKLRIPSIIVSVATLNIFYGLLIFFTGGKYIYSLPDWFATGIFWLAELVVGNENITTILLRRKQE